MPIVKGTAMKKQTDGNDAPSLPLATTQPDAQHVTAAHQKLSDSQAALVKLADSCCMKARSSAMNDSLKLIDETKQALSSSRVSAASIHQAMEAIGNMGAQVGGLYATCCTPKRAPHYRSFYEGLHDAHSKLYQALGIGH